MELKFNYLIELVCGHSQEIQFPCEFKWNEDTEVKCNECEDNDFHLIQDVINLNNYNSFILLRNKKW